MVGVDRVWAIGNHGFETITPDDEHVVDPHIARFRPAIVEAAAAIEPLVAAHAGTQLEDKVWTLSVHYRRAAAGVGDLFGARLAEVAAAHGLVLTAGKMVFELRPPVAVNKGTAALALLARLAGAGGSALYAGDDRTDEDAFRALRAARPRSVTIRILPERGEAPAESAAEFLLPDVASMGAFLDRLAAEWTAAATRIA
jgi:trehalose 6-phosphate phosphatase